MIAVRFESRHQTPNAPLPRTDWPLGRAPREAHPQANTLARAAAKARSRRFDERAPVSAWGAL